MWSLEELEVLNDTIDAAITDSVDRYTRTLRGCDRVATAAMRARRSTTCGAGPYPPRNGPRSTASIFLCDRNVPRSRRRPAPTRNRVGGLWIGEGFAGEISARKEPLTAHQPSAQPGSAPVHHDRDRRGEITSRASKETAAIGLPIVTPE